MVTRIWPSDIDTLRKELDEARFPLDVLKRKEAIRLRTELLNQLDDYLIPRLKELSAPLLVCVGGSTGAGKSTLVNSLIGEEVTLAGVLRPTTRSVVIVHHPDDEEWWQSGRVLPNSTRVATPTDDPRQLQLVAHPACPKGIAIVDTPDVDSVDEENAEVASQLLAAADAWLFVTTASRYADAIPWEYLLDARKRDVSLAVVLNRVPEPGLDEVADHLGRMMDDQGLHSVPAFEIAQKKLHDGRLPQSDLADIRTWMDSRNMRSQYAVSGTLLGTLNSILDRTEYLAALADGQNAAVIDLEAAVDDAGYATRKTFAGQLADGALLKGDTVAFWQEFAESNAFFRAVEPQRMSIKDHAASWIPVWELPNLIESILDSLVIVLVEHVAHTRAEIVRVWKDNPFGRQTCHETDDDLELGDPETESRIRTAVEEWWDNLVLAGKNERALKKAHWRALGAKGLAAGVAVVVLSSPEGPGRRPGAGPGTLAVRLVESALGTETMTAVDRAGETLGAMVRRIIEEEQDRFHAAIDAMGVDLGLGDRLRQAVVEVER